MDTEKLKAWLQSKAIELTEEELAALTSVDQVKALASDRGLEVTDEELAGLAGETPESPSMEPSADAPAESPAPVAEPAAKPPPAAPEAPAAPAGPSPELEAALARIAALEGEIVGYKQREVESAAERTRIAAEAVLTQRKVKPKFLKAVTRELEGQDLTSEAGQAALDALLAEFPEYAEPAAEFPADVPPPPTPTETTPKGAPRHKAWVKD